jgi:hypothetical protein
MSWQLLQETVTMVRAKKITLGLKFVYNPNSIFVHSSAKSPLGLKCKWEEQMGQMALSLRLQEWRETFFTRMTVSQVTSLFQSKGLSILDMEAHSVGASRC